AGQAQIVRSVKADFMRTRRAEIFLLATGVTLLAVFGGAWIKRTVSSRAAVKSFTADRSRSSAVTREAVNDPASGAPVDFTLWSVKRVEAFKDSLVKKVDRPLVVLRIPKIRLEVP